MLKSRISTVVNWKSMAPMEASHPVIWPLRDIRWRVYQRFCSNIHVIPANIKDAAMQLDATHLFLLACVTCVADGCGGM